MRSVISHIHDYARFRPDPNLKPKLRGVNAHWICTDDAHEDVDMCVPGSLVTAEGHTCRPQKLSIGVVIGLTDDTMTIMWTWIEEDYG